MFLKRFILLTPLVSTEQNLLNEGQQTHELELEWPGDGMSNATPGFKRFLLWWMLL